MDWSQILDKVAERDDLTIDEARQAMTEMLSGVATPGQIAGLVVSLRMKGETIEEIVGMVEAARSPSRFYGTDTVGLTHGVADTQDCFGTCSITIASALIAAGAGLRVATYGHRLKSGCGPADLIEGLGLRLDLPVEFNLEVLRDTGFGFFLGPVYDPSLLYAEFVHRELGMQSLFGVLGPLVHSASAGRQVVGATDPRTAEKLIRVLERLGSERAFVVSGKDGLPMITAGGPTVIYRLLDGEITHAEFTPEDFGVQRNLAQLKEIGVAESSAILRRILDGEPGPNRDAAIINASPVLVVGGRASGFVEGVKLGADMLDSGAAASLFDEVMRRNRLPTAD